MVYRVNMITMLKSFGNLGGWRLPYVRNSPPGGLKGWYVWSAALDGEFTRDPTSMARDNIYVHPSINAL